MTTTNRYLMSTAVTFLATFFSVLGANLLVAGGASVTSAVIASAVVAAVRAGFKAVVETAFGVTG